MPKIKKNLMVLEGKSMDAKAKVHALTSSIVMAYVLTKYDIYLKNEQYKILLKCLRLPPDKDVCCEFMEFINEFDDNFLR